MKKITVRVPPAFLSTLMLTPKTMTATETHRPYHKEGLDELNLTLHLRINSQQVVNALPGSIRSIVTHHANGEVNNVKVVEITPSKVVLMVPNSPGTTVPTRTRSITTTGTSTESAITAITAGMQRMTPTTTPTSRSNIKPMPNPYNKKVK